MEQAMASNLISATHPQLSYPDAPPPYDVECPAPAHLRSSPGAGIASPSRRIKTSTTNYVDAEPGHTQVEVSDVVTKTPRARKVGAVLCLWKAFWTVVFITAVVVLVVHVEKQRSEKLDLEKDEALAYKPPGLFRRNPETLPPDWADPFMCGNNAHAPGPCDVLLQPTSRINIHNIQDWMLDNCRWKKNGYWWCRPRLGDGIRAKPPPAPLVRPLSEAGRPTMTLVSVPHTEPTPMPGVEALTPWDYHG